MTESTTDELAKICMSPAFFGTQCHTFTFSSLVEGGSITEGALLWWIYQWLTRIIEEIYCWKTGSQGVIQVCIVQGWNKGYCIAASLHALGYPFHRSSITWTCKPESSQVQITEYLGNTASPCPEAISGDMQWKIFHPMQVRKAPLEVTDRRAKLCSKETRQMELRRGSRFNSNMSNLSRLAGSNVSG